MSPSFVMRPLNNHCLLVRDFEGKWVGGRNNLRTAHIGKFSKGDKCSFAAKLEIWSVSVKSFVWIYLCGLTFDGNVKSRGLQILTEMACS